VPLTVAHKWSGHSRIDITARVYARVGVADSAELMDAAWAPALLAAPGE
jgi:hypothetical protein